MAEENTSKKPLLIVILKTFLSILLVGGLAYGAFIGAPLFLTMSSLGLNILLGFMLFLVALDLVALVWLAFD